ncbi:MAG: 4Fe-4S binding protein [Candidatus Peribacteria bacterium]|jgi:Fe-S-cluster-containing hydrogenase component 2|nr:4Fe-4S binding protein [Candidatus Peribacteria bacterium]
MPAIINFKICDNSPECSGVEVCPVKAMIYDEEKDSLVIHNEKCISCGMCESACPIGAISVAKTAKEYDKIQREIDADTRTIKELFVNRYGASPVNNAILLQLKDLDSQLQSNETVLIEVLDFDDAHCLVKSIPVKELTEFIGDNIPYFKIKGDKSLQEKYQVNTFPSLLVFKSRELVGKIEGYYEIAQQ